MILYAQRVRKPHRGQSPSSARQLPILAALHARSPTLYSPILHEKAKNVNPYFYHFLPLSGDAGEETWFFVDYDEISCKNRFMMLAFCAILLYNKSNYGQGGRAMGELIAVLSGKGGTGKTSVCAGIASALAYQGERVLCIDCDIGLRNLDIALGLSDEGSLSFLDVRRLQSGRCAPSPRTGNTAVSHSPHGLRGNRH